MINAEPGKYQKKLHVFNNTLGLTLRVWVFITLVIMASGMILIAVQKHAIDGKLVSIYSLPAELADLNPSALITLALISILLMPPGILLASLVHFIATREKMPIIACSVLLVLFIASLIAMTIFK